MKVGDIFATKGKGFFGFLSRKLILPYSDRFHFGIIGDYIEDENDWVILESINKGVSVGRLSFYNLQDVEFYRPVTDIDVGKKATQQATKYGRAKYDYRLYLYILFYGFKALFWNILRYRWFHIWYMEIPNIENKRLVCTELVNEAYRGLAKVFDNRFEATPSNFQDQVTLGYLIKLAK